MTTAAAVTVMASIDAAAAAAARRFCDVCGLRRPMIKRPRNGDRTCKECFIAGFESDIHDTIISSGIFRRGDRVAIAASGGKDSTVLAFLLSTLNARHDYGLELMLLAIDEGITGYRDDSLETVKTNTTSLGLPLRIVSYSELYGYSMDQVVQVTGARNNCTFCGVFRRQALDRGARLIGADVIATGHNADDIAETVLMNLLRGDIARLGRCTAISTRPPLRVARDDGSSEGGKVGATPNMPASGTMPRVKPLKYCFEKEIVLYAHACRLSYHSTECVYSPNAYRGFAREWIKDIEAIRPAALLDIIEGAQGWKVDDGAGGTSVHGAGDDEDDAGVPRMSSGCGGGGGAGGDAGTVLSVSSRASKLTASARVQRPCRRCGFMASSELCQACSLLASLAAGAPRVALTTARHARKLYGTSMDRAALGDGKVDEKDGHIELKENGCGSCAGTCSSSRGTPQQASTTPTPTTTGCGGTCGAGCCTSTGPGRPGQEDSAQQQG